MSNTLFPIFLKLEQLQTLVVGGGNVGIEKVTALLKQSPQAPITVVAPEIRQELLDLQPYHPGLRFLHRPFRRRDLRGADLVICASDQPQLHARIRTRARSKHLLINVADTPDLCDFYLGSIVKKGNLKVGISTNGYSPTLAKRLREWLTAELPDEVDTLLSRLKEVRLGIKGDFATKVAYLNKLTEVPQEALASLEEKEVTHDT